MWQGLECEQGHLVVQGIVLQIDAVVGQVAHFRGHDVDPCRAHRPQRHE